MGGRGGKAGGGGGGGAGSEVQTGPQKGMLQTENFGRISKDDLADINHPINQPALRTELSKLTRPATGIKGLTGTELDHAKSFIAQSKQGGAMAPTTTNAVKAIVSRHGLSRDFRLKTDKKLASKGVGAFARVLKR